MNIDAAEMSVFEIVRSVPEVLAAIKRFEVKIAGRDHGGDKDRDEYEKAFTK